MFGNRTRKCIFIENELFMNMSVDKLLRMTEEDWLKLVKKSELLTEEERSQYNEYFDIGNITIEEFDRRIGAISIDEMERRINDIMDKK